MAITAPDRIGYLDAAARISVGASYKRRLIELMDLRPGLSVADIGCGPGTDLPGLVAALGGRGCVVGIDSDPAMATEARSRVESMATESGSRIESMASESCGQAGSAAGPSVVIRDGDAHALPLPDACVDRTRFDRVLQHLRDPCGALLEARRVLRPGGLLAMAEPDWDTLAVADEDVETSRRFARFTASRVLNPTIGRQLAGMATHLGFVVRAVESMAITFRDFETADLILGLRRNTERAVDAGAMSEDDSRSWLARLARPPFLAGFTFYLVTATTR